MTKTAFRALFEIMMEMEVIFRSGSSLSGFSLSKEVFCSPVLSLISFF